MNQIKLKMIMSKRIRISLLMLAMFAGYCAQSQISSSQWPEAKINYYTPPRLSVNLDVLSADIGPMFGLYFGANANCKVTDKVYVNADILKPLLDGKAFINDGTKAHKWAVGGEYVLSNKRKNINTSVTISEKSIGGGYKEVKYRDYDIMTPVEKTIRFGFERYNCYVKPNSLNTSEWKQYYTYSERAFKTSSGGYNDEGANAVTNYIYVGLSSREKSYFYVDMTDLNIGRQFATSFTKYIDFMFAPSVNLEGMTNYKKQYFGFRGGIQYELNRKFIGFYSRMEAGMFPGVGMLPLFFRITCGLNLRFAKMKAVES